MAGSQLNCPKCNGAMEKGFVLDNAPSDRIVGHWAQGSPQTSFWLGTKEPDVQLPIGTYRCSSCGYLEAYAAREFAAK